MKKVSLEERLQRVPMSVGSELSAFEIFFDDFYFNLSELSGDDYYKSLYEDVISKYKNSKKREPFLFEMVPIAEELMADEKNKLLFQMLIEPFARFKESEIEKDKRKGNVKDE